VTPGLERLAAALDTQTGVRRLWWAITAVLVLAGLTFVVNGADGPVNPTLGPATTSTTAPVTFSQVAFRISTAPGRYCALLAATEAQRERGLMGRSDLGGLDGMVFTFPADSTIPFVMTDVPVPLSIAWFSAAGRVVGTADMSPCPATITACPQYPPPGPYRYALEVLKGGLVRFRVGSRSVLTVGGTC